jgi:hypothetical protein
MVMIIPGTKSEVVWGSGSWAFLDIGFSNRARTCGLVIDQEDPVALTFAETQPKLLEWLQDRRRISNLVIEAPLSVSFDVRGNPRGRRIEQSGDQNRYWYTGAGCTVMAAALYMVRALYDARPSANLCLFEGFVSFKLRGAKSRHEEDVNALREIVRNPGKIQGRLVSADELKISENDMLQSAFRVAGMDCGVPAVIMAC